MTDLLWPGDERAGDLFTDAALVRAMVAVEQAWLSALVEAGIAPPGARASLTELLTPPDTDDLAAAGEAGGTPVVPLVALLRERLGSDDAVASRWLHRGLTSQDVLDTALVLCLRDAVDRLRVELRAQSRALLGLVARHRASVMAGRTLTQHAVPVTFGLKAATWLTGLLDAADDLDAVGVPAELRLMLGPFAEIAPPSSDAQQAAALCELNLRADRWRDRRTPGDRGRAYRRCADPVYPDEHRYVVGFRPHL